MYLQDFVLEYFHIVAVVESKSTFTQVMYNFEVLAGLLGLSISN